jgi:signal transduction histidine kinase
MQPETAHAPVSFRLSRKLRRQLLTGLLCASLGLALIVAGFAFVDFPFDESFSDELVEAIRGQRHLYLILLGIALWIWGSANIWIVHRLIVPILSELDQFERTLFDTLQASAVQPPTQLLSIPNARPGLIFQSYQLMLDRLAATDVPRTLYFLEMLSHELRSSMASIVGYATLLADRSAQPSAAGAAHYADIIVKQAWRMNQILESIVTAARVEEGRLELDRTPLRLRNLVVAVIDEIRQQSKREILFEDTLSLSVCVADPLRLREAFTNLIENALKYSGPETVVRVILQPAGENLYAEIIVQDQGIGIAEEELPLLFKRFGRIKKPQTRGIPGNGLGLYIVKHIVDSHGGSITVRSRPGLGTAFVVRLPLSAE